MKSIGSKLTRGLFVNSRVKCVDNSGAKEIYIIDILKKGNTKNRKKGAHLGDIIKVSVKSGSAQMKGKMFYATLIRQIKQIRRKDYTRVSYQDNAGVILNQDFVFKFTKIKGVVSKQAAIKIPSLLGKGAQVL
jgi:large subunit ribosomal protein L14